MDIDETGSVASAGTARTGTTRTGSAAYSSVDGTPAPSFYSYRSQRDGQTMLRELAGRRLNTANELYLLPAGMSAFLFQ